jgi:hypothetical protein
MHSDSAAESPHLPILCAFTSSYAPTFCQDSFHSIRTFTTYCRHFGLRISIDSQPQSHRSNICQASTWHQRPKWAVARPRWRAALQHPLTQPPHISASLLYHQSSAIASASSQVCSSSASGPYAATSSTAARIYPSSKYARAYKVLSNDPSLPYLELRLSLHPRHIPRIGTHLRDSDPLHREAAATTAPRLTGQA